MTQDKSSYLKVLRTNLKNALRQGALTQAVDIIALLKEEDPLSVHTRGLELEYFVASGSWRQAVGLASQLLELFPDSARLHYLAGRVFYHDKAYDRALHHFLESERIHPHWLTSRWLGKTHTQLGRYTQAEALLLGLLSGHPQVNLDLAWLYERNQRPQRALRHVEDYLVLNPEDGFAKAQRLRLRATALGPEDLVAEVDALLELDEPIPEGMLPIYIQRLLETGEAAEARRFINRYAGHWELREAASVAWVCHRLQAYDLALRLFLIGLPENTTNYKYLSALESAAWHCKRLDDVINDYERYASQDKRLYGRIKSLKRRRAEDGI